MKLTAISSNNPLLTKTLLPQFTKILPCHFKPALAAIINWHRKQTQKILLAKKINWENVITPLEHISEQLSLVWSTINHLNAVNGTKETRLAYEECLPIITKYSLEVSQNKKIYQAIKKIIKSKEYNFLNEVQKKILKDKLRDFKLSGVALPRAQKEIFTKLKQQLALLTNRFTENVLEATQSYSLNLTAEECLGLPKHFLELGRACAKRKNLSGYQFSLDQSSYQILITFAKSRSLRKKIYIAYNTRASKVNSTQSKWDNSTIIVEILKARNKLAKLLAFENYAEYSLATKMAKNSNEVMNFLHELAEQSIRKGKAELVELSWFAKKQGIKKLAPWDLAYYAEKLKQEKFKFEEEKLRSYFPLPQVLVGIFKLVKCLYGITIKEKTGVPIWHPAVKFLTIYDQQQQIIGHLYLDLYYRENKRGGAWMDNYQSRELLKDGSILAPVAYIVCNFTSPLDKKPARLTHNDLLTLLHEFGHALQHLLTKVNYLAAAGIRGIPWDAVELASQFMENWGWQKESLLLISCHCQTQAHLPPKLLQKLLSSSTYHGALSMLRQLEIALIDFSLHLESPSPDRVKIQKIIKKTQKIARVTPVYRLAQPLNTFLHIFSGEDGYAAGYYSYKWAELLAADAFTKFQERGIFDRNTGREFLHFILETGGSEEPLKLFEKFRGRPPKIDALLSHYGISKVKDI